MLRALYNSVSGMQSMQDKIDNISNNIANIDTQGYKKTDVNFNDLVYQSLAASGNPVNKNGNNYPITGSGVRTGEWIRDNSQGNLQITNLDTDLALDGPGYFQVTKADGTSAYTRDGNFNLDSQGQLVDGNGNRLSVQYANGINSLSEGNFNIDQSGNITVTNNGKSTIAGKINIYDTVGQDSMLSSGDNLYTPKPGIQMSQVQQGTNIMQGYEELSNVDLGTEMTDMIVAQRAFQLNSKALTTVDDMMGMVNNIRGR